VSKLFHEKDVIRREKVMNRNNLYHIDAMGRYH